MLKAPGAQIGAKVSCQADPGDPMDHTETIVRMAGSVINGELEGAHHLSALRSVSDLPIIGMVKGWGQE